MAYPLQHGQAAQRFGLPPARARKHRTIAPEAYDALTIKPDHPMGARHYVDTSINSNVGASTSGDRVQFGAMAKRYFGDAMIAGSIAGGVGWFDTTRDLFNGTDVSGDQTIRNLSAQIRGAYTFQNDFGYIRPRLDFAVDRISSGALSEDVSVPGSLSIDSGSKSFVSIQPAIEFGADVIMSNGTAVRPNATIGLTHYLTDSGPSLSSHLNMTNGNSASFQSEAKVDRTYLDLVAGIDIGIEENMTLRAQAFGSFSDNSEAHGAQLRFEILF